MLDKAWIEKFTGGVTISNCEGTIIYLNEKACQIWDKDGGAALVGRNLFDCHPEHSKTMLAKMLKEQISNCYTIDKNGMKKLIYQTPLYDEEGRYAAFAELIIELPASIKNFVR